MIGLSFNQIFENTMNYQSHMRKIVSARSAIDASKPKSKMKCIKQPLSQFHRIYQIQLENKHLYIKITNPQTSIQNQLQNHKIIKNNRKKYYQEYERNLQNTGLLRRIKSAKTSYDASEMISQRKQNQQYIQTISKFGYKQKKKNPFQEKIKMITQNSQTICKTYQSTRASKAELRSSIAHSANYLQKNPLKVLKDKVNEEKSDEKMKIYFNSRNGMNKSLSRE